MKNISLITTIFYFVLSPVYLFGQNENVGAGKFDVSVAVGSQSFNPNMQIPLGSFISLPKNTSLNSDDLEDIVLYTRGENHHRPYYSILAGIRLGDTKALSERRLRIGVSYSQISFSSLGRNEIRTTPHDTVIDPERGWPIYRDSIAFEAAEIGFSQNIFNLDVSYVYRRTPTERWIPYVGVGIELGAGFGGSTTVQTKDYRYIQGTSSDRLIDNPDNDGEEETFSSDPSYSMSFYIPIGIDFKLSKTNEFWKRTHLFAELRPSWKYFVTSSGDPLSFFSWGYSALGFRLEL